METKKPRIADLLNEKVEPSFCPRARAEFLAQRLKYKPEVIEEALKHCTEQEVCDGCPLGDLHDCYCGHILNVEVLKYIQILKDLNKTFAQRIEELEGGAGQ